MQIAEAILAQLPDDRIALLVVASAAPKLGDPDRGRRAGAQAWLLSTTDVQKYEAARLTALAAANAERYTLATFWLRRSLNVAPDEIQRARTINDARRLSQISPWSTSLSVSIAPSNNVNGGSDDEKLLIDGVATGGRISEDGVAIAGWRASIVAGTQYRIYEDPKNRATMGLTYQGARVKITEESNVTDEALRTDALQLTLRYDRALENGSFGASLSEARTQYRDFDLNDQTSDVETYRSTHLSLNRRFGISDRTALMFSASRERTVYSETSGRDQINRTTLATGVTHVLENRDRVDLGFSLSEASSNNPTSAATKKSISLNYSWADPVGPIMLSAGIGGALESFPDFPVFDPKAFSFVPLEGGRDDGTIFANINIGFPDVEYFGLRPGVNVEASRTQSNVSRYQTNRISARFTLTSVF